MTTSSPTPPDGVADADWVEQHESTDPDEVDLDDNPTVQIRRAGVEADDADLAEQDTAVPLGDEE